MRVSHQKRGLNSIILIFVAAAIFLLPNSPVEGSAPLTSRMLEGKLKHGTGVKRNFAKLKAVILSSVNKAGKSVDIEGIKKELKGTGPARIILDATWEPQTGDIIDCRGGSILPRKLAAANRGLSEPDTLIHIGEGTEGVQILNCTLDATFPIMITGGQNHRISGNNIRSYSQAIHLFGGNNLKVDHNRIRSTGTLVQINGDSSHTEIRRNHLDFQPGGPVVDGAPGLGVSFDSNPGAIGVGIFAYPGVDYLVFNDRLVQVINKYSTHPSNTVVRENTIDMRASRDFTLGIGFAARSRHSLAEGNIVLGGTLGVLGNPDDLTYYEPGFCSDYPELACNPEDGVCEFLGIGECVDAVEVIGGGRVIAPVMVANRVSGADAGLAGGLSDDQLRWERNQIEHNNVGILLFSYALTGSTIRGNIVSRNNVGLRLEHEPNIECSGLAGLDLRYNDFGDNDQPFDAFTSLLIDPEEELVELVPYVIPTTLPDNWWGRDPCGFPENQEQWPNVVGPSAAALPIAVAWEAGEADAVPRCDVDVEPMQCGAE